MVQRFDEFVQWLKQNQYTFGTFKDFLETTKNEDRLRRETLLS